MSAPESPTPVIVGAGPGGAAAALFLAKQGQASTLLDRARFPRDKICGDALSGKVVEVLRRLAPELVPDFAARTDLQVGSWGVKFVAPSGRELRVPFLTGPKTERHAPGFIAKRWDFDNWLVEQVRKQPLIRFVEGCKVSRVERVSGGMRVTTDQGDFHTPLLIGADGAQGICARQLAGHQLEGRHHSAAVRAYYRGVEGMDAENFIELHFLPELLPGYLWIFPLPEGRANVGLGVRSDYLAKRKWSLRKLLPEILAREPFAGRFRNAELEGDVVGFGLPLGSKKRVLSGDHFLLLGDAASLIDPFTGEGIGNALLSGEIAARVGVQALQKGDFSANHLHQYDHEVYSRLWQELRLGSTMQRLSTQQWLFNWVVDKARRSPTVQQTLSAMFEDINLRDKFRDPRFYWRLLTE